MKLTGLSTTGFDVDFTICGIAKTINFKVNPGIAGKTLLELWHDSFKNEHRRDDHCAT